jgi:hypothetical protein
VLDPGGKQFEIYNRFGEVSFRESEDAQTITFQNPTQGVLIVTLAPDNPRLKELGVRYVLLVDGQQVPVDEKKLRLVYRSENHHFTIYELL